MKRTPSMKCLIKLAPRNPIHAAGKRRVSPDKLTCPNQEEHRTDAELRQDSTRGRKAGMGWQTDEETDLEHEVLDQTSIQETPGIRKGKEPSLPLRASTSQRLPGTTFSNWRRSNKPGLQTTNRRGTPPRIWPEEEQQIWDGNTDDETDTEYEVLDQTSIQESPGIRYMH